MVSLSVDLWDGNDCVKRNVDKLNKLESAECKQTTKYHLNTVFIELNRQLDTHTVGNGIYTA